MNIIKHLNKETTKEIKGSESLFTQKGELKSRYLYATRVIFESCNQKEVEFNNLKYWTRNKGHNTLIDAEYNRFLEILNALKIPYELFNNAPRGGVTGDSIKVKFDGRNSNVKAMRKLIADVKANII
jgi:hypothetical protein